jgi:hypothetical protein
MAASSSLLCKEVTTLKAWFGKLLDALDHPVIFVFALGLALVGLYGVAVYAMSEAGWSGPAQAIRNT